MTRPAMARGSQSAIVAVQSTSTAAEKTEISASATKPRASRLPTMPLHMTTRARKTTPPEVESKDTTQQISLASRMPKRTHSTNENRSNTENEEPLKKKLRSSLGAPSGAKQKTLDSGSKLNSNAAGDLNIPHSRKDRSGRIQNTQAEQNSVLVENQKTLRPNHVPATAQNSPKTPERSQTRREEDLTLHPFIPKVPRQVIHQQYLKRSELARKNASLEQLRRRQGLIAEQYRFMATLAKETNMMLIDKSIELLNHTNDAELATSRWAQDILAVLEQRELKRFQQIEHQRRLDFIDARHEFNVMRNAAYESCDTRILESRENHLSQIMQEIADLNQQLHGEGVSGDQGEESVDEPSSDIAAFAPPASALDILAFESSRKTHLPHLSYKPNA